MQPTTTTSTIYQTLTAEHLQNTTMSAYIIPIVLLLAVSALVLTWFYRNTIVRTIGWLSASAAAIALVAIIVILLLQKVPLVFSPPQLLEPLWHSYKVTFIEPSSGRTIDPSRATITTSEGESYTMLRAVWRGDKTTFDTSWSWTQANLERPDHLFRDDRGVGVIKRGHRAILAPSYLGTIFAVGGLNC